MKNLLCLIIFLINCQFLFAQEIVGKVKGTPLLTADVNLIEGTPYLSSSFSKGSFTLKDGKTVNDLLIKFNIFKDIVTYQDKGVELQPTDPIKQFIIEANGKILTFQKGFPAIEKFIESTYYEILNEKGIPKLLKKISKVLISRKEYNSSKITDTYLDNLKYYTFTEDGRLLKLKINKNNLELFFPVKQKEMLNYINKKNLKLKQEEDLIQLFDYYSSIR